MRHWIFDLDGTLVDSFANYLEFVHQIFARHGLVLEDQDMAACLGQPAAKFLRAHLGEENLEAAMMHLRTYSRSVPVTLFGGMREILNALKAAGCGIGVWTSRDRASTESVLSKLDLGEVVDIYMTSCCTVEHKPHPEGLLKIAEYFRCAPQDLTVIGDHDYDVTAAKAIGARGVRAGWHQHGAPATCAIAEHIFHRVDAFSAWVLNDLAIRADSREAVY